MIEGKGLGGKKIDRVNLSLSNSYSRKLNRLAAACGMKRTSFASYLLEMCLDDPVLVMKLQNELNKEPAYKVVPVKKYNSTEVEYVLQEVKHGME